MGSKLYIRMVKKRQVLILLVILTIILGCPDPNRHIWFVKDGKLSKELLLRFQDDKILVKLGSSSGLGSEQSKYHLQLIAEVRFSAELRVN